MKEWDTRKSFRGCPNTEKEGVVNLIIVSGQNDSSWTASWLHTQSSIKPRLSCNYIFFMWIQLGRAGQAERAGQHIEAWDDRKRRIKRRIFLLWDMGEMEDKSREKEGEVLYCGSLAFCVRTEIRLDRISEAAFRCPFTFVVKLDAFTFSCVLYFVGGTSGKLEC